MSNIDYTSNNVSKSLRDISVPMLALSALDYAAMFIGLGWLSFFTKSVHLPEMLRICGLAVSVLEALFGGLLSAIYIYANTYYGKKDRPMASYLVSFGVGVSCLIALLVTVSGKYFGSAMVGAFTLDPETSDYALRYLSVIWWWYIISILFIYFGLIAKLIGDMRITIGFHVVNFVADIFITPSCIYLARHFGLDMIKAAALAAVLGKIVGLLYLMPPLLRETREDISIRFTLWIKRSFPEWKQLGQLAFAETINSLSLTLSFFLFFVIISHYEEGALAVVTVAQYFVGFFQTIFIGAISALIPFVAQNVGMRKIDNIRRGVRWMAVRTFAVCIGIGVLYILLAGPVTRLFIDDPVEQAKAVAYIRITALPWAMLLTSFSYIFAVVGLGDARGILLLTIWSMYLGNLLPLVITLLFIGNGTMLAAYTEAFANAMTLLGCMVYYWFKERSLTREWSNAVSLDAVATI